MDLVRRLPRIRPPISLSVDECSRIYITEMDIIDAPVRDAEMDEIWDDDEPSDEDDAGTQVTGMTGATGGAGGRRPMMFQTITRI